MKASATINTASSTKQTGTSEALHEDNRDDSVGLPLNLLTSCRETMVLICGEKMDNAINNQRHDGGVSLRGH